MTEELKLPHVHMKDREKVLKALENMVNDGKEKLQVIVDFDRTMSKFAVNGKANCSCYGVLDNSRHVPESYKTKSVELKAYYYAIETDPNLSIQEKYPHMMAWYNKAHALLTDVYLDKDILKTSVEEAGIALRDEHEWMFKNLHSHEIPLLIFSAGLGDVIEEILAASHQRYDNMKVVANFLKFNEKGVASGFAGEMIHVYNKNESVIHESDYFKELAHRHNVILMGDSLGDLRMAEGAEGVENIITIGFLNDKVEESLPKYKEAFDIVLVQDESLKVPNALFRQILNCNGTNLSS